VVIGGGTAGLVTAAAAAGLGARAALVERHLLGGDCLNVGCVPSKCLIRSARAAADARQAATFGVSVQGVEVDFAAAMERMRRIRSRISHHDAAHRLRELGVDVFLGEGRFTGPDRAEVNGKVLSFAKAVIATGARAVVPPVPGLAEAGYLTNETVFSLTERPERLAVFGAGPLGCELAQVFQRLGSQVILFERGSQFLTREDPDAAALLAHALARDGVEMRLKTTVDRVETEAGGVRVHFTQDGRPGSMVVDRILVGAGRAPNVEGLNLEAAGVAYDPRRGVEVDDFLRSSNPRIYAAGDICLAHKFTHTADAAARIALQNALFLGRKRLSRLTIPWCTYTDPEIAHVGLYERDAVAAGIGVQTLVKPLTEVDRALADGEEEGFVKIHLEKGTDRILGATIVARHAGEMIGEIAVAMAGRVGLGTLAGVIHPYPTPAEAIRQLGDLYNKGRLTPLVKGLLLRWLAWARR